ncbi:MAG: 2-amino-4-hydroxy-6-hydroxymethyldihydropteridine diphosphokinase, partial [Azospira oryzae]
LLKESSLYQTSAWGKTDQPDFLNQVIEISYEGDPFLLLKSLLDIESKMGRVRIEKWGTRIIDIDILFYGNTIVNGSDLRVPHPQIPYRRFTLIPLVEIAPDFIHPVLHQSNTQLLHECTDLLEVKKLSL